MQERILARQVARDLSNEEIDSVSGGFSFFFPGFDVPDSSVPVSSSPEIPVFQWGGGSTSTSTSTSRTSNGVTVTDGSHD